MRLRVQVIAWEAPGIHSYELQGLQGEELPAFSAGAHVVLTLSPTLQRSYSLINSQTERHRYVIAVQKDRASRGGSKWVHDHLRVGDVVEVSAPRNNFALDETARRSVFISGGIGITPILGMIDRLETLGREWSLIYCARTRDGAAFVRQLESKAQVRFQFDEEPGGAMLDIGRVVGGVPADAHLYCCGPGPMLKAFEHATKDRAHEYVHVEYFASTEAPSREGGFEVQLAKTGAVLTVAPGQTILDVLLDSGVQIPYSCREGLCGTCEIRVLDGEPEHRDLVLSSAERLSNTKIMVCCSGSRSPRLVLDL